MEVLFHMPITRSVLQPRTTSLWKAFWKAQLHGTCSKVPDSFSAAAQE